MSNKYLFNEEPKSFSPTIAKALGSVSKAVIMQQVHFWLHVYTKKADQKHFFDGHYWVFNSYSEWHKDLDFIPFATMKRQILELERGDLLISSEFNKNRGDRTKWYRINYERLTLLTTGIELNRMVQNKPPSDHFEPPSDHFEPPSDHFEPPSDHFEPPSDQNDPLYIQSDQQSDQLIDQQPKEVGFCENLPTEEKTSNLSDLSKPEDQETPPPPTPSAPLPPENIGDTKRYNDPMGDRFADKKGARQSQTKPWLDDEQFLQYLFVELSKTKKYFRDLQDKNNLTPIKEYVRKSWLLGSEGEVRFADVKGYRESYERHLDQLVVNNQHPQPQPPQPQEKLQRLPVPDFVLERVKRNRCIA